MERRRRTDREDWPFQEKATTSCVRGRRKTSRHAQTTPKISRVRVIEVRNFLIQAGCRPRSRPNPPLIQPGCAKSPDRRGSHGTKIFQVDVTSMTHRSMSSDLRPASFLHHLVTRTIPGRGPKGAGRAAYYEKIAQAAALGGEIIVVGHGTGKSNAAHHLTEYLRSHHSETYQRIVREIVADLSSITTRNFLIWPQALRRDRCRPCGVTPSGGFPIQRHRVDAMARC